LSVLTFKFPRSYAQVFLRIAFFVISSFSIIFSSMAYTTSRPLYSIEIPRSSVAHALNLLSEQTNISVLFSYRKVKLEQANAIIGLYSIEDALEYLLRDTNYRGTYDPDIGIQIHEKAISPQKQSIEEINKILQVTAITEEDSLEVIQIVGTPKKTSYTVQRKRYSNFIVDSYNGGDLGHLPVENIAQAIQRVSGVAIDRQTEKGVFATVRGFGPEFNTVLYNGRVIATENQGREFSFDVLSPEVIRSTDVYKSSNSNVVTGSIGSTINLITPKPMANPGVHFYTSSKINYNSLVESFSPETMNVVSYANEHYGALFSFNYQETDYQVESAHVNGWFQSDLSKVENKLGSGDFSQAWLPRNLDLRLDQGTKLRGGGNFIFEAVLTDSLKVTFDLLYSQYEVNSNISSSANWTHLAQQSTSQSQENFSTVELDKNNTLLAYEYVEDESFATDFVKLNRSRPTKTNQLGLNFDWYVTDSSRLIFDVSYSSAVNDNGGKQKFIIAGAPNANPIYTLESGQPYANLSYQNAIGVADLRSHGTLYLGNDIKDNIFQGKVDAQIALDYGFFDDVSFGVYASDRTKTKDSYGTPWGWEFAGYEFDIPDRLFTPIDTSDFLSGGVPNIWYDFDPDEYVDFLWSDKHIQREIIDAEHWLSDSILVRKAAGGVSPIYQPGNSWRVNETIFELYSKFSLSNHEAVIPWFIDFGFRFADTRVNASGVERSINAIDYFVSDPTNLSLTLSDGEKLTENNHYSHFLTSLNIKLDITAEQVLRFAVYETISRPSLSRLFPNLGQYSARVGSSTAWAGDTSLQPFEALNYDLAWSWYFNRDSYFTTSFFIKNIDNFVYHDANVERLFDHPEGDFLVLRSVNGDSIQVKGVELAFNTSLSIISAVLNKFELQARYTLVDGDNPNNDHELSIEGLSNSYNALIFYRHDYLEVGLAYTFRDDYLRQTTGAQGQPEMVEAYSQIDLNVNWKVSQNFSLFFEGNNLLNQHSRTYSIYHERLLNYENNGTNYSLGFRLTL